jgi:hypothetical protein
MIAQSQSGTGKTAAFVLAMLSRVDPSKPYPQVPSTFPFNALTAFNVAIQVFCQSLRHPSGTEIKSTLVRVNDHLANVSLHIII